MIPVTHFQGRSLNRSRSLTTSFTKVYPFLIVFFLLFLYSKQQQYTLCRYLNASVTFPEEGVRIMNVNYSCCKITTHNNADVISTLQQLTIEKKYR